MKEPHCYNCKKEINKKTDLYYLFISHSKSPITRRDVAYLHFCDVCFHENTDSLLINRLNCLSSGSVTGKTDDNWRTCPYCKKTLSFANVNLHFQVSEIIGSEVNSITLHSRCYYENIGITEDAFSV